MMLPIVKCSPIFAAVKKAARHVRRHHAPPIGRTIKRTAGVVASKPAAIVWTCIAVPGAIGWLAWPEQPVSAGVTPSPQTPLSTGASTASMLAPELPPEFTRPDLFAFVGPPDIAPTRQLLPPPPEQPEQPTTPVPEPGSVALLVTSVAALALIRWRT